MKTKWTAWAALFVATISVMAQDTGPLPLDSWEERTQVSATITDRTGTLKLAFQHLVGVTPPYQLLLILETPAGVNVKQGRVVLYLDGQEHPIKAYSQDPLPHKDGVTEVSVYYFPVGELRRLSTVKNLGIRFEGPNNANAFFHLVPSNTRLKNYFDFCLSKK
jgi:hypothetical protein